MADQMTTRKKISDVFTTRNREVNDDIYVHRPDLEKALKIAIAGSLHVVIFGESGSGKSWLYKKVLQEERANFVVVNGGNVSRNKSIAKEILTVVKPPEVAKITGYSEKGEAGASVLGFKAKVDHQRNFAYDELDPLFEAYSLLQAKHKDGCSFVVLDNLELIISDAGLMDELASILTLLDDTNFAKFKVRFILVGTRREIRDYFQTTKNLPTVANRLEGIPEVKNLNDQQVFDLLRKGFVELLLVNIKTELLQVWSTHVAMVTLGNPAAIHQYCTQLASALEEQGWQPNLSQLADADKAWLSQLLKWAYDHIELLMNEKRTELQRRNQVLYALSVMSKRAFDYVEVQNMVKFEFPSTTKTNMNIAQVLSELAGRINPIIKKTSTKGQSYEFTQPAYLMCLRVMLKKTVTETVEKLEL